MKIGILTLHNALNFGAFLQAFALQSTLQEMGGDIQIIDLEKHKCKERLMLIKCKHPRRVLYNYKFLKKFDACKSRLFISVTSPKVYDAIIIGSDEVWNLLNNTFVHRKEYFGEKLEVQKIISYAVSANRLTSGEFTKLTNKSIDFSRFSALSVRDKNTCQLVKDVCAKNATIVLDPTLIYHHWSRELVPCRERDFILMYNFTTLDWEKKRIQDFARKNNLKIISVGSYNPWCDKNVVATPFEFLGYIQSAAYVITSSFHGVAFSIIFNKKFVVFPQSKAKVIDLMESFSLQDRDATTLHQLDEVFDMPIDYCTINKQRNDLANKSKEWLYKALCIKK